MVDFSSPQKKLEDDLEDIQMDVYRKEKELKALNAQLKELERNKELLEDEIGDLREKEESIRRDIERIELELE